MSEKYKALRFDGVHRANSLTWNPHKLLGALLQCSTFHINEKVKHYQIRSGPENLLTAWKSEHVQEILLTTNKVEFKWDFVNLSYYLGTKSIFTSSWVSISTFLSLCEINCVCKCWDVLGSVLVENFENILYLLYVTIYKLIILWPWRIFLIVSYQDPIFPCNNFLTNYSEIIQLIA